jgi:hypothetical protein
MLADTLPELHAMADQIGIKRKWFQDGSFPHYDICKSKKKAALEYGAIEINAQQTVDLLRKLRDRGNEAIPCNSEKTRLEQGMLIKTNYSGPYRIKEITRNCTCPSYKDQMNKKDSPRRGEHLRLVCSRPDGTGNFYLDGFVEDTLKSLDKTYCGQKIEIDHDCIVILEKDRPVQMSLF